MVLPAVFLIHSGTLTHTTAGGVDAYGQPNASTSSSTTPACRFIRAKETIRVINGSPIIATTPRVLLPAATTVSIGDTIASTETGFTGTFRINSVDVIYEAAQKVVSHIACDIAAVA